METIQPHIKISLKKNSTYQKTKIHEKKCSITENKIS
jgi:hypothetical protein